MIDQLITRYLALRDKKTELKRGLDDQIAKIDEGMERIEKALAEHMAKTGAERIGSANGVAYFSTERSATVADRESFFQFLEDTGMWHLADIRAAKKQISDYRDEMNDLPPGINWREAKVVRVNRA